MNITIMTIDQVSVSVPSCFRVYSFMLLYFYEKHYKKDILYIFPSVFTIDSIISNMKINIFVLVTFVRTIILEVMLI